MRDEPNHLHIPGREGVGERGVYLYGLYRYVRTQRVCFFLAILVTNWVWFSAL